MSEREEFEKWYAENAFDYAANPIGTRDCGLQYQAWRAAKVSSAARIAELEAKLAEIEKQEPVAWAWEVFKTVTTAHGQYKMWTIALDKFQPPLTNFDNPLLARNLQPLYTLPPLRELSDEEIDDACIEADKALMKWKNSTHGESITGKDFFEWHFVREILAKARGE